MENTVRCRKDCETINKSDIIGYLPFILATFSSLVGKIHLTPVVQSQLSWAERLTTSQWEDMLTSATWINMADVNFGDP